ncbi:MAG: alpha/beta fold hydrolase, partial [Bryobacteraceae bacterium]
MNKDNSNGLTRRELGGLAAIAIAAAPKKAPAQTAPAGNPGPALDITDWSYHWIGVEHATLARGTMCNGMQMYVEHWIPREVRHPYPVVLIHGGYGQGSDWISTPDGHRGWATLFLEQGYQVYVIDRPGQGRNPYHPWVHGYFDKEAPTFEAVAKNAHGDPNDPAIAQLVAAMGQPMGNNPITQSVWRSRGAKLLDEIGPAILIAHGDGARFAAETAGERGELVKGIVTVDPPGAGLGNLPKIPSLTVSDRDALQPVLQWLETNVNQSAPAAPAAPAIDPKPNRDNTALKLADQGCFWVGVQRKKMSYGTIALGQMYVQYMIPAEKRYPYPVIMVHGGGGQGCHMMGIGGRPGWVHYFVQAGYSVYWLDRPSYGRSPYHPDALGPSHLPNVPPYEGLVQTPVVFNTAQWPGPGGMNDPLIDQFMACESGNVMDEAFHSDLVWRGGVELVDRIGPCILLTHAFGGFFGWGVADRRPKLVKGIFCMEINGNPFAGQLRWGLTASPMTYDPPVTDPAQF